MAWRKPTIDDLSATLSQRELDAFRQSAGFSGADPAEDLVRRTAEMVRSYCRANTSCRLSPVEGEIPEALISPAMDYAAYDVLKRLPVPVNEDRRRARDAAVALFERVADGKTKPEPWQGDEGDVEPEQSAALPVLGRPHWYRL